MANASTAFGFRHIGGLPGSAPTFEMSVRAIQSTFATPISFGDPVVRANATSAYIVNTATTALIATTPLQGIFVGCQYQPTSGGGVVWSRFWPGNAAATDAVAYVIDSPEALFLASSIGSAIGTGQVGLNVGFAINSLSAGIATNAFTAGNLASAFLPTSGNSPFVIDGASVATTNTLPFKIRGVFGPSFGNFANNAPGMFGGVGNGSDPTSLFNWVIVTFNQQAYQAGQSGE